MPRISSSTLAAMLLLCGVLPAVAGPDLKPKFNTSTGMVQVANVGDMAAGATWVTVSCAAAGGASCPDPAPAAAAPYLNPAFPNKVAIQVSPLAPGAMDSHVIAFFGGLVFAPGTYAFTVCADAKATEVEDSERNNCTTVKKSVRGVASGASGLKGNAATD